MAMKRGEEVGYTKFRVAPVLADGLLAVDRDDGGAQRRVAAAFGRLADQAGAFGDMYAQAEGRQAGLRDALAGGPGAAEISGGAVPGSGGEMAYAGGAVAPATGGGDLAARAVRIRDGLVKRGLTPLMASAATGHARQESSLNAAGPDGDNGTSSGLFQWRNERRSALQAFARKGGGDWRSEDVQLDFFVHELKTRERTAWTALQRAGDLDQATAALMHFERPQGYSIRNPRGGHGWANRLANAQWAAALGGGAPADTAPAATAMSPAPAKTGAAAAIERQITPADVAPPSVTPISIEPGKAGGFRPTGALTIRGQAYDAAGTQTYLQELDATMRSDVAAVYDRFKDDPAALAEGFNALKVVQKKDHVFPEIAGDYEAAYGRMVEPYQRQALANQEKRVLIQNRADFLTRTQELENDKQRAIETFDADNDDSADALASVQASIDTHYDSAVAHGVMDPDDAVTAKATSRREAAIGFYGKQAGSKKSAEDILAFRETLRKDFAAGKLDGVDGDAWQKLDAGLGKMADERLTNEKMAVKELTSRGETLADAVLKGASPSSPEISKFMLDAKTAPGGSAIVKLSMDRMGTAQLLRDKTLAEGATLVRELEADAGHQASGLAKFARDAYTDLAKGIADDPTGTAEARGIIPPLPDLFDAGADMGSIASSMKARLVAADAAAEHFGVEPKYLKPGEAAGLKKLAEQNPDAAAQIAGGLVAGAGPRVGQVLAELGTDAPALRQAGMILGGGGSPQAARDVIAGYAKGPDGRARPVIDKKIRDTANATVYGEAFAGSPRDGTVIEAAAHAMARARVTDSGADPKSEEAGVIYRQALQEAAGAVYDKGIQYGGVVDIDRGGLWGFGARKAKVMVPPWVRADRFADVVDSIRDQDLVAGDGDRGRVNRYFASPPVDADGKPYRASDLKAARPVAVRDGYRFAMGDPTSDDPQWIRGADGAPFVLSLYRMRDRLEARVPGAFR